MFKWFKKIFEPKFKVGDKIRAFYKEFDFDNDLIITKVGKYNYQYHFENSQMLFEDSIASKDRLYEKVN